MAARVTISTAFFAFLLYKAFNSNFSGDTQTTKKYNSNLYSRFFIHCEYQTLLLEKKKGNKILF